VRQKKGRDDGQHLGHRENIFRYWIEIREVASGSMRSLPLQQFAKIHIPRKKNEEQRPREAVLRLVDGTTVLEATSLEGLAAQLREKYPDPSYERTLHQERDPDAEKVRGDALDRLAQLVIEAFTRSLSREDAAALDAWFATKEGEKAFRESWPQMVDAYFHALSNPQRRSPRQSGDSSDRNG
jgi:hypothetical protein